MCNGTSVLSVKHLLAECPYYTNKRLQFFYQSHPTLKRFLIEGETDFEGALFKYLWAIRHLRDILKEFVFSWNPTYNKLYGIF